MDDYAYSGPLDVRGPTESLAEGFSGSVEVWTYPAPMEAYSGPLQLPITWSETIDVTSELIGLWNSTWRDTLDVASEVTGDLSVVGGSVTYIRNLSSQTWRVPWIRPANGVLQNTLLAPHHEVGFGGTFASAATSTTRVMEHLRVVGIWQDGRRIRPSP